jgi:hypothetical protein
LPWEAIVDSRGGVVNTIQKSSGNRQDPAILRLATAVQEKSLIAVDNRYVIATVRHIMAIK